MLVHMYNVIDVPYGGHEVVITMTMLGLIVPCVWPWTLTRCDRILWHGFGLRQLAYVRAEARLSDHRPVYAVFSAEVDVLTHKRLKDSFKSTKVQAEEMLLVDNLSVLTSCGEKYVPWWSNKILPFIHNIKIVQVTPFNLVVRILNNSAIL